MSLRVTFLGTGGAVPTPRRNTAGIFLAREGEQLLFDAGEGTQRQMMRFNTGFAVSHVFVTHLHGDHVLGLPGLLQTWDFQDREAPLTIHAPRGTRETLLELVHVLDHDPAFPISIDEVAPGEVAYRAEEYEVRAFPVDHRTRAVGWALIEDARKGRFDRERAEELGVPVGPKFSRLHEGEPVELDDGTVVESDQVVGPPRPGRSLVYTGDTRPTEETARVVDAPDLLIHDGTFADDRADRASETAHSTAREAGRIAAAANARQLALVSISSRYADDVSAHEREASEAFDGTVLIPEDGTQVDLPFPDAGE